jgi:threonine dehydrogenase-like Zn-dependent dehydrogenase
LKMETKAVRLHGALDIRLDTFELPPLGKRDILVEVLSNSLCTSTYKCAMLGEKHKRVPADIAQHPVILGHEMCIRILQLGEECPDKYQVGRRYALQTAILPNTFDSAGYSFEFCGGNATYMIIPAAYVDVDALIEYTGKGAFEASLSEPYSCVIQAFHSNIHLSKGDYGVEVGTVKDGNMLLMAGVGSMGLAAIDYAINCDRKPKRLVVTGRNAVKLAHAAHVLSREMAAAEGVDLIYVNEKEPEDLQLRQSLLDLTNGQGYNDIFVFAPSEKMVEMADSLLSYDGCLNFFAGPMDTEFKASINFYNVHYNATHHCGSSGGSSSAMKESLEMMSEGRLNPAVLVSHVGGLNSAAEATLALPKLQGFKKIIYPHIEMPLTNIADFRKLGKTDPVLATLADICEKNGGLWCAEAEQHLLKYGKRI